MTRRTRYLTVVALLGVMLLLAGCTGWGEDGPADNSEDAEPDEGDADDLEEADATADDEADDASGSDDAEESMNANAEGEGDDADTTADSETETETDTEQEATDDGETDDAAPPAGEDEAVDEGEDTAPTAPSENDDQGAVENDDEADGNGEDDADADTGDDETGDSAPTDDDTDDSDDGDNNGDGEETHELTVEATPAPPEGETVPISHEALEEREYIDESGTVTLEVPPGDWAVSIVDEDGDDSGETVGLDAAEQDYVSLQTPDSVFGPIEDDPENGDSELEPITVEVVNEVDGEPVEGADVIVHDADGDPDDIVPGTFEGTTDEDGVAEFDVPAGTALTLNVEHPQFDDYNEAVSLDRQVTVQMPNPEGAAETIRIVDTDGDPIEGAEVVFAEGWSDQTNSAGEIEAEFHHDRGPEASEVTHPDYADGGPESFEADGGVTEIALEDEESPNEGTEADDAEVEDSGTSEANGDEDEEVTDGDGMLTAIA